MVLLKKSCSAIGLRVSLALKARGRLFAGIQKEENNEASQIFVDGPLLSSSFDRGHPSPMQQ